MIFYIKNIRMLLYFFSLLKNNNLEALFLLLTFFNSINSQIPLFYKIITNFFTVGHYTNSQDSRISIEYVDFLSKIFLILYTVKLGFNPKRCGLFGQLRRRRGGPKWPTERKRYLDASIFIQTQQTVPHMKADIFS